MYLRKSSNIRSDVCWVVCRTACLLLRPHCNMGGVVLQATPTVNLLPDNVVIETPRSCGVTLNGCQTFRVTKVQRSSCQWLPSDIWNIAPLLAPAILTPPGHTPPGHTSHGHTPPHGHRSHLHHQATPTYPSFLKQCIK